MKIRGTWLLIAVLVFVVQGLAACETPNDACVYDGVTYGPDETFRGTDGCSICHCTTLGEYQCEPSVCLADAGPADAAQADSASPYDALFVDQGGPDGQALDAGDAAHDAGVAIDGAAQDALLSEDSGSAQPCDQLLVERVSTASVLADPSSGQPELAQPFVYAATGITVTRMSDGADADDFSTGYTNGYSRWSPASFAHSYLTAFASNGGAVVYRSRDRSVLRTLNIGESNELHWDASGSANSERRLYYRQGASLRRLDVESGDDVLVHDFSIDYPGAGAAINGVEGAPSRDMRYWAFQICASMSPGGQCEGLYDVIVYDMDNDSIRARLSDHDPTMPTPNFVDISPSGSRIVVGTCAGDPPPYNGMYAWDLDFSQSVRLSTGCTHSGWAFGKDGEEYFVSQDPCGANNDEVTFSCDYITAVDVNDADGWAHRVPVLGLGDLGWGNGIHIGRIYDDAMRGWFFISTYSDSTQNWGRNQLLFVELVAHDQDPRLWRISPTFNAYQGYWSEAFASLDFQAQAVYWGANWMGQNDLQLYQADLCSDWPETLNAQ